MFDFGVGTGPGQVWDQRGYRGRPDVGAVWVPGRERGRSIESEEPMAGTGSEH